MLKEMTPTILTLYVNTTLFPSFKFDESFSGLKISCHFLIRKPRPIWLPLMILRRCLLHICTSLIRTTGKSDAINLTIGINFYLTESCYNNIIERPSHVSKIWQIAIDRLVKFYFVTHVLERLSIIWVVPRSRIMVLKPNGHLINGNFILLNCPCFLCGQFNMFKTFTECLFL